MDQCHHAPIKEPRLGGAREFPHPAVWANVQSDFVQPGTSKAREEFGYAKTQMDQVVRPYVQEQLEALNDSIVMANVLAEAMNSSREFSIDATDMHIGEFNDEMDSNNASLSQLQVTYGQTYALLLAAKLAVAIVKSLTTGTINATLLLWNRQPITIWAF